MMNLLLLGILFVIEVAIIAVSLILAPDDAGIVFWGSVGWICFLVLVNWIASAAIFSRATKTGQDQIETGSTMAVLPGVNVVIFVYSICSIAIMLYSSWLGGLSWSTQFAYQIGFLALMAVIVLIMFVAVKGAQHGAGSVVTKAQLLAEIRRLNRVCEDEEIKATADAVSTYVSSSMPHPSKLSQEGLFRVHQELSQCDGSDLTSTAQILDRVRKI